MPSTRRVLIIFISLVLAFSALAFASDPEPEQAPLEVEDAPTQYAVDLELGRIRETAADIKAAAATSYTTDDIYNLLYAALRGSSSSTTYSLPYIGNRLGLIYNILSSSNFGISKTYDLLNTFNSKFDTRFDTFLSRANDYFLLWNDPNAADLSGVLTTIMNNTEFSTSNRQYSLADLTGMIWSLVQDIGTDTSTSSGLLASLNSNVTAVGSLDWTPTNSFTPLGFTTDFNTFSTSAAYYGPEYYFGFTCSNSAPNVIYRLTLPVNSRTVFQYADWDIKVGRFYNNEFVDFDNLFLGYDYTYRNLYIYFTPFQANTNMYVHVNNSQVYLWNSNFACDVLPLNSAQSYDFYNNLLIRSGFNSLDSIYGSVDKIASYFVSPEKQAAESASQDVIDETLDGFTGDGAAAAKMSDSRAMKNVSSDLQSGLDAGGNVSQVSNVFQSNGAWWSWFTQSCSNQINNPYPAPVVTPTRGSGDEIVDFLSPNNEELQRLLSGGDQR